MESRKYISLVRKAINARDEAFGKETTSEECDKFYWELNELSTEIFKLTKEEYEKLKKYLTTKIEALKKENNPQNKRELHILRNGLGYLEFYTKCRLEESGNSVHEDYNNSEWSILFEKDKNLLNDKQKGYFDCVIARIELSYLYNKITDECGCELYLSAFDGGEITDMLPTVAQSRLDMFGVVSSSEYRSKHPYGKFYNYDDRNEEYYEMLLNNCDSTINLFKVIVEKLLEIKEKDSFKGVFETYNKEEIEKFVESKVKSLNKSIAKFEKIKLEVEDEYKNHFGAGSNLEEGV